MKDPVASSPPPPALAGSARALLFVTVAISGAAVLIFEILGSRLIGPFFGSSLHVWSSIIATTLLALATGYALGGIVADRAGRMDVLFGLLLAAAVSLVLVPLCRNAVLQSASSLGPQLGALVSAVGLLFLPLTLLAGVTPLAYKIATADLQSLGRTVGFLSAISTLGSVGGALLAGFYLIGALGSRNVCWVVSAVLALPALYYFARRRSLAGAAGGALWAVLLILAFAARPQALYADAQVQVLERSESMYGQLLVVDWRGVRFLVVDGTSEGFFLVATGQNANPYEALASAVLHTWRDLHGIHELQGVLCGLGPGALPQLMSDVARIEVFELDPRVPQIAAKYFGFDATRHPVHVGDGRRLAMNYAPARSDFVMIDAYASDAVPFHLMSTEAIATFKRLLKPGGIMVLNVIGIQDGKGSEGLKSIYATLGANFAYAAVLNSNPASSWGNFILMAADQPLDPLYERLPGLSAREVKYPPGTGTVLTDDRNPVDLYWRETARLMRKNLWESLPPEVILD